MLALPRTLLLRTTLMGAAVCCPAVLPAPEDVGFGVDPASIVAKRFAEETSWELTTMETTMDDEPVTQELPLVEGRNVRTVRVVDEYEAVADGRIENLLREFVEVGASSSIRLDEGTGDVGEYETRSTSGLEETLVRFRWNDAEERYAIEFEEGGDDSLLRGLDVDMDLLALLPDAPVEVDDSWELDGAALAAVLRAGGDLRLRLEEATPGSMFGIPSAAVMASAFTSASELLAEPTGELTAKLVGTTERDGRKLAEVELVGQVRAERDLSELLQAAANDLLEETSTVDSWTFVATTELEFEATLLWDLQAGRLFELTSKGEFTAEAELAWDESIFGGADPSEFTAAYEIQGTSQVTVSLDE